MSSSKGFTLIELIVVIVILGIIALVTIPAYIDMRDNAKVAALKGQLGTIRSAMDAFFEKKEPDFLQMKLQAVRACLENRHGILIHFAIHEHDVELLRQFLSEYPGTQSPR